MKKPSEVLSVGQEVEVLIRDVNVEKQRVSLGYKQLQPKPWVTADQRYPVGSIVEGKVVRIVPFGAFVALEPTIDGLIHISQLGVKRVANVEDELHVGDVVRCKVLDVNTEAKRISLSRREALIEENPEIAEEIAKEKAERERVAAERAQQRAQQDAQRQQERENRRNSSERRQQQGDRPERSERRERPRRDEDAYDLPPWSSPLLPLPASLPRPWPTPRRRTRSKPLKTKHFYRAAARLPDFYVCKPVQKGPSQFECECEGHILFYHHAAFYSVILKAGYCRRNLFAHPL